VTPLVCGDPASVSALGADLGRQSQQVQECRAALVRTRSGLAQWRGPTAEAFGTAMTAQLLLLEHGAEALAEGARALQMYAVDLQHARALAAAAQEFCQLHGLHVDAGGVVRAPWGAYPLEESRAYEHHVPQAQRLVDRAVAERDDATRMLRLRVQGPTSVLAGTRQAATRAGVHARSRRGD